MHPPFMPCWSTNPHLRFIGISFTERPQAFDFNVALADFEKQQRREVEIGRIAAAADPLAAAQTIMPEAAALYMTQDLRLKEGETIKWVGFLGFSPRICLVCGAAASSEAGVSF